MGVVKHDFSYNGVSASTYLGVTVYGVEGLDEIAAKDVSSVVVPGRNGVLHLDNHRWNERTVSYLVYLPGADSEDYADLLMLIRETFGSEGGGYLKLKDTYYPNHFSLATFAGAMEPESMAFRTKGIVKVNFNCRPERFLDSGDDIINYTTPLKATNPTSYIAEPEIYITGSGAAGTVTFSNSLGESWTISVSDTTNPIYINCETYDMNYPARVTITELPKLRPGDTNIAITGGVTKIEMKPRWWTL